MRGASDIRELSARRPGARHRRLLDKLLARRVCASIVTCRAALPPLLASLFSFATEMNNSKSFVGGWAAFFGCTMTGAGLGYYRWKGENAIRIQENVALKKDREERLKRMGEAAERKRASAKASAALAVPLEESPPAAAAASPPAGPASAPREERRPGS